MSAADTSDPKLKEAFDDIKSSNSNTNWILFSYAPKSDTKIVFVSKGTDGLKGFTDNLSDGKIFFGLLSFSINKTKKFTYVCWCGEGVTGMKKGLFNNHSNDLARFFKGFHVQINARNEDDLNEKKILEKLTKATGASYDSGAKHQGESKAAPASFSEAKSLATKSNATTTTKDKSDYNKKSESEAFWQKQKEEEEQRKNQPVTNKGPSADYNKTAERDKFWSQQKQEQEAPKSNRPNPSPVKANSNQSTPPSKPQVNRATPVVKQPEPEPQQEQYSEEPQQEQYPEEPQQEQYSEEPQQEQYSEEPQQEQYSEEPQQEQYPEEPQQEQYPEEPQQEQYPEETQQEQSYGTFQCKAIFDYDAENPGDLSFREGDIINVLDSSDPSGWWQGEHNGVTGYFPSNFVEQL